MVSIGQRDFRLGLLLAFIGLLLSACAKNAGPSEPTFRPQTPEKPYTGNQPIAYTGPLTTITGTARYNYYDDTGATGLNNFGAAKPIRHAEVHILDAAGNEIQRGETNGSGAISLTIPRAAGSYVLRVNSRAENVHYRVSVLADPYNTQYYSLDTGFSLTGSETTLAVTIANAPATNSSSVLGGAFSILDQILEANEYLRTQVTTASSCTTCVKDFDVAPKIQIYWQKGLTPAAYYGSPQSPISFFLSESGGGLYRGIYMLGGIEGDVCTDTDHFDRSVILHEYGHFLENAYGKSSSPGGSHNGNEQLDPRLAWSEGWADFFQAAVLGRSYYRDTKRNGGCPAIGMGSTAQLSFPDFRMDKQNGVDVPGPDEGIFREISVARTLYASIHADSAVNDGSGPGAEMKFAPIWQAFRNIGNNALSFQNMGQMNMNLRTLANSHSSGMLADLDAILAAERQVPNQTQYAEPRSLKAAARGSCSATYLQGTVAADTRDSQGYITSTNMQKSNDYYRFDYDGNPANGVMVMRYAKSGGSISTPYDLDVYVYTEKHVLLNPDDIRIISEAVYPETGGGGAYPGYEYINFTGLPAGRYLINVKAYYLTSKADTTYFIETPSGDRQLCP